MVLVYGVAFQLSPLPTVTITMAVDTGSKMSRLILLVKLDCDQI
ncbi:hypothetical protein HMPREF1562_3832 [Providencia alcalifaciens F90-2004]|nr:hypothetical protein HMPREF1562_3832 [Providencia alcalifaciens F90-2004]